MRLTVHPDAYRVATTNAGMPVRTGRNAANDDEEGSAVPEEYPVAKLIIDGLVAFGTLAVAARLIGTLRRDCLDHLIVLNERHLRRVVARYLDYYHDWRTHLSLSMDAPNPRIVRPREQGRVVQFPDLGGLHHHYERLAA